MIRCVRIWTGDDDNSHAEEGWIDLAPGVHGDLLTDKIGTTHASFQETSSGGTFAWHTAPVRQLVITLSGTLDFETRGGQHFTLAPGDILLAEDTVGGGHSLAAGRRPAVAAAVRRAGSPTSPFPSSVPPRPDRRTA